MRKETRTVVYDEDLRIEAYRFEGIVQPFPNHFHDYYVIGLVENGQRCLSCKNKDYNIENGHILLFNPRDNHFCTQTDGKTFDYRGFNISAEVMLDLTEEITGKRELTVFSQNVVDNSEIACCLRDLHDMVMCGNLDFGKEETLFLLISSLIKNYGQPFEECVPDCQTEIEKACEFIHAHFNERIYLDQICRCCGLSKSTLLRAFTKTKGITPYRYLETIRINKAKALLEQGVSPIEVSMQTGFSDQSHFTNYFNSFIGLAPGAYREIFSDRSGNDE